jgi:ABC-2 type transport system permease protein
MTTIAALLGFTARQTIFDRKIILTLLLLAGPTGLVLLVRALVPEWQDETLWKRYHAMMMHVLLGGVLPLTSMVHGPALISIEADNGTLVYLLTRRMRRATVLLTRFVATAFVLLVITELAVVACHFAAVGGLPAEVIQRDWAGQSPGSDLIAYMIATVAAVPAFLAIIAAITQATTRSLVASGVYVVIFELALANIPAGARAYSINHHVRRLLISMVPRAREVTGNWHSQELVESLYPKDSSGALTLTLIVVGLLAVSAVLVSQRELLATKVTRE